MPPVAQRLYCISVLLSMGIGGYSQSDAQRAAVGRTAALFTFYKQAVGSDPLNSAENRLILFGWLETL